MWLVLSKTKGCADPRVGCALRVVAAALAELPDTSAAEARNIEPNF